MSRVRPLRSTPLDLIVDLARAAGRAILDIRAVGARAQTKPDGSPVTAADREAERIILIGLRRAVDRSIIPDLPIIAEEAFAAGRAPRVADGNLILVDALDGTKEFVRGGDDFTVNVAIVEHGVPVLGVVYQPATDTLYAADAAGAWRERGGRRSQLQCGSWASGESLAIVASRSHRDARTDAWIEALRLKLAVPSHDLRITSVGSSLKFCLVAEGNAHLYPRFGRTMQWDTAAGDAILRRAGGLTVQPDGTGFEYGRPDGDERVEGAPAFANPPFVSGCRDLLPSTY